MLFNYNINKIYYSTKIYIMYYISDPYLHKKTLVYTCIDTEFTTSELKKLV